MHGHMNIKKNYVGFTLSQATTAHRESRGIALLYFNLGTRSGLGVSVTLRPHLTPGKEPVPIIQEAGWASGPVWTSVENLAPTWVRSPDRPARRRSLNRYAARPPRRFLIDLKNALMRYGKEWKVGMCKYFTGNCHYKFVEIIQEYSVREGNAICNERDCICNTRVF
jgi:hypothetical protein